MFPGNQNRGSYNWNMPGKLNNRLKLDVEVTSTMAKQELLSTYTAEQLSEKGNKIFKASNSENCQKELDKFLKESPLESTIGKISRDIIEQKNNAMAMEFTRIICDLLKKYGVFVHCTETKLSEHITHNSIEEKYGIVFDSMDFSWHDKEFTDEIEKLKNELERSRTTVNQIDDILRELFGVTHDIAKPDEFKEILSGKAKECIADFLPAEPIKVADMLINAEGKYEHNPVVKKICGNDKGTYRIFDVSELRQIAEHLLVYCNNQKENVNE